MGRTAGVFATGRRGPAGIPALLLTAAIVLRVLSFGAERGVAARCALAWIAACVPRLVISFAPGRCGRRPATFGRGRARPDLQTTALASTRSESDCTHQWRRARETHARRRRGERR